MLLIDRNPHDKCYKDLGCQAYILYQHSIGPLEIYIYIYIYIYVCVCVCVCIYIYIYIHTHTHIYINFFLDMLEKDF